MPAFLFSYNWRQLSKRRIIMQKYTAVEEVQLTRLEEAGVFLDPEDIRKYLDGPDTLELKVGDKIPAGYKKCGRCGKYKKFYLFNRNKQVSNKCSGNCKDCQRAASKAHYATHKNVAKHKENYQANREARLQRSREYYLKNKDRIAEQQKKYHQSAKGKKVMKGAHAKRKYMLAKNAGIPYTLDMLIERDKQGGEFPICILCGKPIEHQRDIHIEHLIPVVLGGADDFTNVGCAHQLCNLRKSKDAREITTDQVSELIERSECYMDEHPEQFKDFF